MPQQGSKHLDLSKNHSYEYTLASTLYHRFKAFKLPKLEALVSKITKSVSDKVPSTHHTNTNEQQDSP